MCSGYYAADKIIFFFVKYVTDTKPSWSPGAWFLNGVTLILA